MKNKTADIKPQIPGYKIIDQIAQGGMSTVYLAIQESLQREVALKVMAPALAANPEFSDHFLKEARTIAQLTHRNIVSIYDVGKTEFHHYIAMEYLAGGDLKTALKQGMNKDDILSVIRQMVQALSHAHKRGFLHRDIKPENIMFRQDGTAVLTDFGIARAIESSTSMTGTDTAICTPQYISPEYALGKTIDGRSDLYSLGIVLYEALTGQLPFEADTPFAIAYAHVHNPIPKLPPDLKLYQPLMDQLLAKDPERRYQHPDDLLHDLDLLQKGKALTGPAHISPVDTEMKIPGQSTTNDDSFEHERIIKWLVGVALSLLLTIISIYLLSTNTREVQQYRAGQQAGPGGIAQGNQNTSPEQISYSGQAILSLETIPKQVQVFLDRHHLGTAPNTWTKLPAGRHVLRLEHKYYNPLEKIILLEANKVKKEKVILKKGSGAITIVSRPERSQIYLDHTLQNKLAPATLEDIAAGIHTVTLHHDHYYDLEKTVEVKPGQTSILHLNLKGGNLVYYKGQWIEAQTAEQRRDHDIKQLLLQAEQQRQHNHLMLPPGDNAYETYLKILTLDRENVNARQGIRQLANRYLQMTRQAIQAQNLVKAHIFLARAAKAKAPPKDLVRLQQQAATLSARFRKAARQALQDGQFQKAICNLQQLVKTDPGNEVLKAMLRSAQMLHRLAGDFVPVKGGCFQMGCGKWQNSCDPDEKPVHKVCVHDFSIGKFEITQAQWKAVMKTNPSRFKKGDNYPVENVSWNNVQVFINRLNRLTGRKFRLPTEAEWEYAARSRGRQEIYAGGGNATRVAWFKENSSGSTHPVGQKDPNNLGIYDMSGNVWEWCQDWYAKDYYQQSPQDNPQGPAAGSGRVGRGGCWNYEAKNIRTTFRDGTWPGVRDGIVGFRLVLTQDHNR